jgi:hypothetical protein
MFADDLALLLDTIVRLQEHITCYNNIALVVKRKVLVFKRGGQLSRRESCKKFNGNQLEIVSGWNMFQ